MHTNGFGFATTGVRCRTSRNLPQVRHCFCVLYCFLFVVCFFFYCFSSYCLFLFYCFFGCSLFLFYCFFFFFVCNYWHLLLLHPCLLCCWSPQKISLLSWVGQSTLMPWDESDSGGFCQYLFCSISYFWILCVSSKIFPCPLFLFVLDQFSSAGVLLLGWCLFSSLLSLCSSPWTPCKVIIVSS